MGVPGIHANAVEPRSYAKRLGVAQAIFARAASGKVEFERSLSEPRAYCRDVGSTSCTSMSGWEVTQHGARDIDSVRSESMRPLGEAGRIHRVGVRKMRGVDNA